MHPLKAASLLSWFGLLASQATLLLPGSQVSVYWSLSLVAALLVPLPGLIAGRTYTYRWIGFLMLVYFCIGISELAVDAGLRGYALGTTICSVSLFLSAIYFARRQAARPRG
jgi:uncharacterized membrane protein